MGEHTHTCCCDHSEEALLKRIGELAAEYKGKEGSLIQVLHKYITYNRSLLQCWNLQH